MEQQQQLGPKEYFDLVADEVGLEGRDRSILEWFFGVNGERLLLREIGERLDLPVSRQRVHAIVKDLKDRIGPEFWGNLERVFPSPESDSRTEKEARQRRSAILKALRAMTPDEEIQYAKLHRKLGVPIPEHRLDSALFMDEMESCYALMEDYTARNFGKYRYCTGHKAIEPIDNFYKIRSGSDDKKYVYQLCKACNTERCINFTRQRNRKERELASV